MSQKKLPKTGNIIGRFMRSSGQVEREIDRPSRGRRQRPSTGSRAEHDRRVAERRGKSPKVRGMLGRIGPAIQKDIDAREKR